MFIFFGSKPIETLTHISFSSLVFPNGGKEYMNHFVRLLERNADYLLKGIKADEEEKKKLLETVSTLFK